MQLRIYVKMFHLFFCYLGSPFKFTADLIRDRGAHRVHAEGPGLERGEVGQLNEFNLSTRDAGAGSLSICINGPSKAEIVFKDREDGSYYISYVANKPGWLMLF